ncbi:MAG: M3 family oligoendopeptidase [Cyanothece sp. SIO1E1]|nr:M3 family oligoendopeptidase [Cyanothece sp. SIO1E1]
MTPLLQTWDNRQFFSGSDDPLIEATVHDVKANIAQLATACAPFANQVDAAAELPESTFADLMAKIRAIHKQHTLIVEQLSNTSTFIQSVFSVDTQDIEASTWLPALQQVDAELQQALKPLDVFLMRAGEDFIQKLVGDPILAELAFSLQHRRQLRDQLLSVAEEQLIAGLAVDGLHSWGNLYDDLAGSLKCQIDGESVGLAKAANLLGHATRSTREAAWRGINQAWTSRQQTVAAILNALNGWRLEETRQRARIRSLHYLDQSCHQNHIERATLDALIDTTYHHRTTGQRALKAMAKVLNQDQLAPWDAMAPAPSLGESNLITFEEAIALIASAFRQLTPAMGDFAVMMAEQGWIDAKPTPNRTTGAYCTQFSKPREPRIFLTFTGTLTNVMTLAHELGHAWHNWVMRDLPLVQTAYPMTLAETASIFAETLVRDALWQRAADPTQKLEIAWQDAQSAGIFLINIPARFEFEKQLVEARKQGFVIAKTLKQMMRASWQIWYEDSLSEYDEMFWASKLHFSMSSLSFYNYPYLFGYLFSLGIYAQRHQHGADFNQLYTSILRDTGGMTAEELVNRYLQQDIRQPEFWQNSLAMVEQLVKRFETLVEELST